MSNFTMMYKKTFMKLLEPYGYNIWNNVFFKEVDNNICFFIYGKKVTQSRISSKIEVYVDVVPYCADLQSNEYDPKENNIRMIDILKFLLPENFTNENIVDYFSTRFVANNEEATNNSLNNISSDIEKYILPYIHKLVDLGHYYIEMFKIWGLNENDTKSYANYFTYGLSLKLHKYRNAIPYIEHQIEWHNGIIKRQICDLEELNKGNIAAIFNTNVTNDFIAKLLKKRPDFVKSQIEVSEHMMTASKKEVDKLQIIKMALIDNDHVYIDKLVEETEKNSREYIRQMIMRNTL